MFTEKRIEKLAHPKFRSCALSWFKGRGLSYKEFRGYNYVTWTYWGDIDGWSAPKWMKVHKKKHDLFVKLYEFFSAECKECTDKSIQKSYRIAFQPQASSRYYGAALTNQEGAQ